MPLITQAASTFSYLTGVPPVPPTPVVFPKDTIIPYYSASGISSSDWDTYTFGDGKYIKGTTSSSVVGTSASGSTAAVDVYLGSTGAHTGSVAYVSCGSTALGSTINNSTNSSAGAHSHTGTINFAIQPQRANVTLIKANKAVSTLPANTIAFRNRAAGSYGTSFLPGGTTYFMPGASSGTITSGTSTSTVTSSVGSAGTHRHHLNTNQYYITGKLTNYWGTDSGSHYHSISGTMSQTIMNTTMILDAWTSASTRTAMRDVIVMYAGNPADLPPDWFLCNGSNGTINMNGYFLGLGSSGQGAILSADASVSTITVGSIGSHSHIGTYSPAGAGITLWHGNQAWNHTHTLATTVRAMFGNSFSLYFIQYKG